MYFVIDPKTKLAVTGDRKVDDEMRKRADGIGGHIETELGGIVYVAAPLEADAEEAES